ncbi:MAG TPA: Dam family site-specific DNA-(adenine-N6)-methyltransferase [Anaerohalosphaeraceae bacterium]|nr:Dam family site-specific DNA-(adenine-N6)-methyltransferase [Anaerohalosphaeraceae bacterium]
MTDEVTLFDKIEAKPFIKWVGGKRSLLDVIIPSIPKTIDTYYEPFIGGGAVFFALVERLNKAILSDHNLDLVITYTVVKKEVNKLIKKLREHQSNHCEEYFYYMREQSYNDSIETAARFLYLNKTCYNGLYRVNQKGKFNTPIGKYTNPNIVQEDNLIACSKALEKAEIKHIDFEEITPQKGDFVYFDPPYHPTDDISFTQYTKNDFTEKDQIRLKLFISRLHRNGIKVMLSNSKTHFILNLYKAKYFKKQGVKAPRYVNCKVDKRGDVEELLITNYETGN